MEWKFDEITRQTTKVDPAHLEFFRSEALSDAVSALVREDIQNRLDAKKKGVIEPVRVRYYISGEGQQLDPKDAAQWLRGLEPHLNAPKTLEELSSDPLQLQVPMPFLVIEDFNTTGLNGDPMQTSDPDESGGRNDFYWFIRNVGRTGKKAGDRGRWGLGKIVYPASSSIRSFYAYSVRAEDHQAALIGRSVLAIHALNGCEYHSEGYFALFPDPGYPYFAAPQQNDEAISRFVKCFNIQRRDNEPGLSLVIPFPETSITWGSLVSAIIHHYFWEILRNNLTVEISNDIKTLALNKETIQHVVATWSDLREVDKKTIQRRLEFCLTADGMQLSDPEGYFELSIPGSYGSPKLSDLFESEEKFEAASRRFRDGKIVALECVVEVKKVREGRSQDASFLVYLQRDNELDRADETFIRDGLTIIGESYIREPGVRALILAEDPVLTEFLGDAENPAHTRWLPSTKHFIGKYSPGKALLDYVKYAALKLTNLLGKVEDEMLENLLDDVFGIEKENETNPTSTKKRKKPKPSSAIQRKNSRYLEVGQLKRGFTISPYKEATRRPDRIRLRVAYETQTGDPFSAYHPADFNLAHNNGEIKVTLTGCRAVTRTGNAMLLEMDEDQFRIQVEGFDPNRDLRVDAKPEVDRNTDSTE